LSFPAFVATCDDLEQKDEGMTDVTGAQVFAAFRQDPRITALPDDIRELQLQVFQPYVEALPDIARAADLLDAQVTVKAVLELKLHFAQYCLDDDIMDAARRFIPDVGMGGVGRDQMVDMMESALRMLVETLPQTLANLDTLPPELEALVLFDQFGLSYEHKAHYDSGALFVSDLLVLQPGVIVINEQ
jgi:hypothetical protein